MENEQALIDYIIGQLSRQTRKDEIIQTLVAAHGMHWGTAENLVNTVIRNHGKTIARRSAPFLLAASVFMIVSGIGLAGWMAIATLQSVSIPFIFLKRGSGSQATFVPYSGNVIYFLIGCVLFIGGVAGIGQVLGRMRNGYRPPNKRDT